MVRINGKKFKIYELDDINSFKYRLASSMNTLDYYLYFPNDVTTADLRNKKGNIIVEDILTEIKDSAKKNTSVVDLLKSVQSKVGIIKYDRGKDIIKIWLAYNKKLKKDVSIQGKYVLDLIGEELQKNKFYLSKTTIHTDWISIKNLKDRLDNNIQNSTDSVQKTLELFGEYDKIEESSAYTDFEIEHIQFILTLEDKGLSLLEIFNSIQLNSNVPFCTTQNFYKILQDFIPPEEWANSSSDSIILQVYQKTFDFKNTNISNYETAIVKVDPVSHNIIIEITINTANNNITRDIFIERTLSVFKNIDTRVKKIDESKVIGVFYYPILHLNKYIFSDLVMNDPIFSRLISIDDHDKATKMKPGIYIHFEHPYTGYITATLTEKIMIKGGDTTMKNVDLDFFEPGEPFIRVKISKANNEKAVDIFKEILGKLFIRYAEKENDVINYYKNYIPDFGDVYVNEVIEEPILKHSDLDPNLFVTNYTRNCKPDRMPTIISEEDAIKAKSEGKHMIKFPRDIPDDPNAFKFPMDGDRQHYYVCNNPGYKYVGLKNNKLKNADKYPYVPCCFKLDQQKKPKFLNYYEGKELITGHKKQHNIISTDKILKYDQFGTLPLNLENLFTIMDPDPKYEYVRKGVYGSKNSFINVVMEALNDETNILDVEDKNAIEKVLLDERFALANKNIVPLCRQELYDRNVKEIINMIKNPEVYFDPRLFIHLIEDRFDCNIFLFTRKYLDGEMILPRHLQTYQKNINKKRSIYVYEHMGSESDHAKYPQCELIIKYNTKKGTDLQYSFTYKESKNINNIYSRLRKAYSLNEVIKETYMPINEQVKIKSQWIDSYGKTRRLNIFYKMKNITIITSPLQPIKIKETTNKTIFLTDIDTAMDLIETLGIQMTSQTVIDGTTKEINGILGNVIVSIPLDTEDKIIGIPKKEYGLSYPEKQSSALQQYNTNKKIARYLTEYTMWIYSTYLNVNGIIDITDHNISNFARDFFVIKPNYVYGYIEKTLKLNSPILDNGKIVVHDKETIKRLIYVLRLNAHMNVDSVKLYHERKTINKYYIDITDFDKYSGQVILYGDESINKWMFENNVIYNLHDEIKIGVTTPYFFKNINIDNNVYLAQNTQNLEKASDIAVNWIRNGNNVGLYAKEIPIVSFTLYSYKNSNDISKGIPIKGKPFSNDIKILGYKVDDNPEYTVLLPLDQNN